MEKHHQAASPAEYDQSRHRSMTPAAFTPGGQAQSVVPQRQATEGSTRMHVGSVANHSQVASRPGDVGFQGQASRVTAAGLGNPFAQPAPRHTPSNIGFTPPGFPPPPTSTPVAVATTPGPREDEVKDDVKNVIIFGETGVGKSSVINMIRGTTTDDEAPVSSGAVGCTFASVGYPATLDGEKYILWDTAGLNEGAKGSVTHDASVANLSALLAKLDGKVHLLVYCFRGKRFRQVIQDNYDLFYKHLCRKRVPIGAVVTGLEAEEPNMENWWVQNAKELSSYGLKFDGHACITASRGKALKGGGFVFDDEYEESEVKVKSLVKTLRSVKGGRVYNLQPPAGGSRSRTAREGDHDMAGGDYQGGGTMEALEYHLSMALNILTGWMGLNNRR